MRAERLSGLRLLSSEAASSSPLPGGGRQNVLRVHPPDRSVASADLRPRVLAGFSKAVRSLWRVDLPPQVETQRLVKSIKAAARGAPSGRRMCTNQRRINRWRPVAGSAASVGIRLGGQ